MWWKCDLQVATAGWKFTGAGPVDQPEGRAAFSRRWVDALTAEGIQVVALADHHGCSFLEDIRDAAGEKLAVFPGVEVTSASGSDGAHLVFIGPLDAPESRVNELLREVCGFNDDNPPFGPKGEPASSPRSVSTILDNLPEEWLVFAPHALNDNGLASNRTIKGDGRWKALHHDRLMAIDVGDGDAADGDPESWNSRFRRRDLDDFPCLSHLAFIATSDAYDFDRLGERFTWVRMEEPSLEGLRQAFLDYEARLVTSGDARLGQFIDGDPNNVSHAWIEKVSLTELPIADAEVVVEFDPRFNVIVGGRGSGKSTVVAALRHLYASAQQLPDTLAQEAAMFDQEILSPAVLQGTHLLALQTSPQEAVWIADDGSQTTKEQVRLPTDFPVRVVSQKELFERAAGHSASQNLRALVDESLSNAQGWEFDPMPNIEALRAEWAAAVESSLACEATAAEEPAVQARIKELESQVAALDDADATVVRERANDTSRRMRLLRTSIEALASQVQDLEAALPQSDAAEDLDAIENSEAAGQLGVELDEVETVRARLVAGVQSHIAVARAWLEASATWITSTSLAAESAEASEALEQLQRELGSRGLDEKAMKDFEDRLTAENERLQQVKRQAAEIPAAQQRVASAWDALMAVERSINEQRSSLLQEVEKRSANLRFEVVPLGDGDSWVPIAREALGLRADGFLEEVGQIGEWLTDRRLSGSERVQRYELWRDALVKTDFSIVREHLLLRQAWWDRLGKADSAQRLRLAALLPAALLVMSFLREGGDPQVDDDWQEVSHASPGQRSAAMLSFILHHGNEPLVLDQPEDDLDSAWVSSLIIKELRRSRWARQLIVVTHNANIPVLGDCERVIVMENVGGKIGVGDAGAIENVAVRKRIQDVMEGGVEAFVRRERRYDNELSQYRRAMRGMTEKYGQVSK